MRDYNERTYPWSDITIATTFGGPVGGGWVGDLLIFTAIICTNILSIKLFLHRYIQLKVYNICEKRQTFKNRWSLTNFRSKTKLTDASIPNSNYAN